MIRQTPRSTRTDTHFTYTRLFRSFQDSEQIAVYEVDIFRRGGFPVPQQNGRGAKGIDGILDLREILHERGLADIGRHLEVHLVAGLLALIIELELIGPFGPPASPIVARLLADVEQDRKPGAEADGQSEHLV